MKKIAYLTDFHLDETFPLEQGVHPRENLERVLADLRARNLSEVIIGGDIGAPESHGWFFGQLEDYTCSLTLGNHDQFAEVSKHYRTHAPANRSELYYSREDEHFQFIFLDSSSEAINDEQLRWLAGQLASTKRIVLFVHHPVLEIRTPVDTHFPLRGREKVQQLLRDCQQEVVIFCAHYHMDDETTSGNITQVVTPAVSFQIRKDASEIDIDNTCFGYRIITVDEDRLGWEVILHQTPPQVPE